MNLKLTFRAFGLGSLLGLLAATVPGCTSSTACDSKSCSGCCTASGVCLAGNSTSACGASGVMCVACGNTQTCAAGTCALPVHDGGTGGGTGGGTTGGGTGGGTTGGGTGGGSTLTGAQLYANDCASCHGAQAQGGLGPNISFSTSVGIGTWTQTEFIGTVRDGINPQGRTLCAEMMRYSTAQLADSELAAIYGFLGTTLSNVANPGTDCPFIPDAGPVDAGPMDLVAQLTAIRAAADADAGMVHLAVTEGYVTYLKPLVADAGSADPAGFFVQAYGNAGPAVFVALDPATVTGGPVAAGDRVSFTATTVGRTGLLRMVKALDTITKSLGGQPPPSAQEVSAVDFSQPGSLDTYESELVSFNGTFKSALASSGPGYRYTYLTTAGTTTWPDGGYVLKFRVPNAMADTLAQQGAAAQCTAQVTSVPFWRFNAAGQPSAFSASEVTNLVCPVLDAGTPDAGVTDAGTTDAGVTDAGTVDAGALDAGVTDAGTVDAGLTDAGSDDAGTVDAGTVDAGTDAGTVDAGAPSPVVISQVYGGGGNTGATYKNDFIELKNVTTADVSLAGLSLQYSSATGTWSKTIALTGSIKANSYFLVGLAAGSGGVGASLPTTDLSSSTPDMSASAGKVALVNATTLLTSNTDPNILDLVGYGTTANFFWGSVGPAGSNTVSVTRAGSGCTNTRDNGKDFAAVTPSARNSSNSVVCP